MFSFGRTNALEVSLCLAAIVRGAAQTSCKNCMQQRERLLLHANATEATTTGLNQIVTGAGIKRVWKERGERKEEKR